MVVDGEHGLGFVVLLIAGRVVRIVVKNDELSELDDKSVVEKEVEVSEVLSELVENCVVESVELKDVEVISLSCVELSKLKVVDLVRSTSSIVEYEIELSKVIVGTDCVIVDVYTKGASVGI